MTKYFSCLRKFSGFWKDSWIITIFDYHLSYLWIYELSEDLKFCFLDLTNFSTAICLKDIDSKYVFGFEKYFWIVPFRLPYILNCTGMTLSAVMFMLCFEYGCVELCDVFSFC